MLDGSGGKAMPGSFPAPNSDSLYKKIQVAIWATPKNRLKNNNNIPFSFFYFI